MLVFGECLLQLSEWCDYIQYYVLKDLQSLFASQRSSHTKHIIMENFCMSVLHTLTNIY